MFMQIARYVAVGLIFTLLHVSLALFLRGQWGWMPLAANLGGFLASVLFSYLGHAKFTFKRSVKNQIQFAKFLVTATSSLTISSLLVWLITDRLGSSFGLSMLAVAMAVPALNFIIMKVWVFKDQPSQLLSLLNPALAATICGTLVALLWGRTINHDTAWYLIATRKWLEGAQLYTHISEVNPPLNFYYTAPIIWLSDRLSVSGQNSQYLVLSALTFMILFWGQAIVRKAYGWSASKVAVFTLMLAASLILPAMGEFAQREHLFVLLVTPWLLLQATDKSPSKSHLFLASFVAAMGICLKPHFVFIPLAVTLVNIWQARSLRPLFSTPNLTFLAVGLSYVAYVAIQHPAYFTLIVPIARDIYGAYGAPALIVFVIAAPLLLWTGTFTLAALSGGALSRASLTSLAAIAGSFAIYWVQGTGFNYHLVPLASFTMVGASLLVLTSPKRGLTLVMAITAFAGIGTRQIQRGFYDAPQTHRIIAVVEQTPAIDSIMVLTSRVSMGPGLALRLGVDWASSYSCNWLVPGAVNRLATLDCEKETGLCAQLNNHLDRNRRDNIRDIKAVNPDLIIIDKMAFYFDDRTFSWEEFMKEDPEWSIIISKYEIVYSDQYSTHHRLKIDHSS